MSHEQSGFSPEIDMMPFEETIRDKEKGEGTPDTLSFSCLDKTGWNGKNSHQLKSRSNGTMSFNLNLLPIHR